MIGYIRTEEAAKLWGTSPRQVQEFCKNGRIEGAVKFGNTWAIPEDAKNPTRRPGRKPKAKVDETKQDGK